MGIADNADYRERNGLLALHADHNSEFDSIGDVMRQALDAI